MLARALALNPKVLLLDDFTARVDATTERAILKNIQEQYPGITLISVTQKIASVENYDQIILLMEGEVLATGTHGATDGDVARIRPDLRIAAEHESTMKYKLENAKAVRKQELAAGRGQAVSCR